MSQFEAGARTVKQKPTNNIYSALVFVAFVALTIGVSVVWYYNLQMTNGLRPQGESFPNPWHILEEPAQ